MDRLSYWTAAEWLAIVVDYALIVTLAIGLPIHAMHSVRKTFVVLAEPRRGTLRIYIGVRPERFLWWTVLRLVEFALFVMCVHVWWRRLGVMAGRAVVREQEVARFEVRRQGVGHANAGAVVLDGPHPPFL